MRKAIIVALAAAAVPSIAVAAPGGVHGKPAGTVHGKPAVTPAGKGKVHLQPIAFIARGTAAATSDTVDLTVTSGNRTVLRAASSISVKIDGTTRIRKAGKGKATAADITVGDRLVVLWRTPRGTAVDVLPVAKMIVDRGPKPTPAETPEQDPAPESTPATS
jgi:hypothetical protein